MIFSYFPPANPRPDQALDNSAYAARHCKQTKPGKNFDLDLIGLFEYIAASAITGRKGDAGYITACDCVTTRKEGGPASFVLIDYDDRPEGPDWTLLDEYQGFAWTTASGHPHWRVLIPLKEAFKHGKLHCPFPGGHIRNRTQPAFLPTHPADVTQIQWRALGGIQLLDGQALGSEAPTFHEASESKLGAMFKAAGWVLGRQENGLIVKCPWQHEHTGGKGGGTVVFHADPENTGLGKFSCGHGHCTDRTSFDVMPLLEVLPAVRAELKHWPEPDVLSPYTRVDTPPPAPVRVEAVERFIRGPELALEAPPPEWLIRDMEVAPGRPPVLSADAGGGKTWALQSIALSVASGRPVFERFECRKTPVLHISRDSSIGAVKRRYQKLSRGMGIDLAQTDITVFPHRLQLVDKYGAFQPAGFKEIMDEAAKGYGLVILDSITSICAGLDENSVEIAYPLAATYDEKCVWWWAHHNGKNGGYRGSSSLKGVAGVWWTIGEDHTWSWIKRSEDTDGGPMDGFQTEWLLDGPGARIVANTVAPQPRTPEESMEATRARIREDILKFLEENNGASGKRLAGSLVGKKDTIYEVAKEMTSEGVLTYSGQLYYINGGKG